MPESTSLDYFSFGVIDSIIVRHKNPRRIADCAGFARKSNFALIPQFSGFLTVYSPPRNSSQAPKESTLTGIQIKAKITFETYI